MEFGADFCAKDASAHNEITEVNAMADAANTVRRSMNSPETKLVLRFEDDTKCKDEHKKQMRRFSTTKRFSREPRKGRGGECRRRLAKGHRNCQCDSRRGDRKEHVPRAARGKWFHRETRGGWTSSCSAQEAIRS